MKKIFLSIFFIFLFSSSTYASFMDDLRREFPEIAGIVECVANIVKNKKLQNAFISAGGVLALDKIILEIHKKNLEKEQKENPDKKQKKLPQTSVPSIIISSIYGTWVLNEEATLEQNLLKATSFCLKIGGFSAFWRFLIEYEEGRVDIPNNILTSMKQFLLNMAACLCPHEFLHKIRDCSSR